MEVWKRRAYPAAPMGARDSQRDVNVGSINVLRSIQANFMTMQGRSGKNNGYPFFDGTFKG
jgi:hypothetical protein